MTRRREDDGPRVRGRPARSRFPGDGAPAPARGWGLLLLLVAATTTSPAAAASLPIEWLPAAHPVYEEMHLLYAEGLLDTTVALSMRPKARADLARWAAAAERRTGATAHPGVTRLAREFSRERVLLGLPPDPAYTPPLVTAPGGAVDPGAHAVRFTLIPYLDAAYEDSFDGDGRLADRSAVGLRLGLALGPVLLYQDLFAGRYDGGRRFSDPLVNDTDFLLYTEDFYATVRTPWLDLSLGRTRHAWGPGPQATLLHDRAAGPMTHFSYSASLLGGQLTGRAVHADVDAAAGARLAEHGLEWVPTPALQFSLFEAARYRSDQWEPLYVLSLVPFTLVQKMLEQDALGDTAQGQARNNVIAGLGARVRVARGHVVHAELLVDDINLEESGAPVRLGYQLGWTGVRSLGGGRLFAGAEWSRVYRYVYSVYYGENFIHQESAIGYPEGPDVRVVSARAGYDFSAAWRAALGLRHLDDGEGTLGESYDPAGPPASGSELANATTSKVWSGELRWTPRDGVEVGGEASARTGEAASDGGDWGFLVRVRLRH